MPIPDFQTVMLPLLEFAGDGKVRAMAEYRRELAERFQLTEEEREALLPSGRQPVFNNRVAWASVYLQRAGLLARPQTGHYQITERGKEVLQGKPKKINVKFLQKYPEFNAFRERSKEKTPSQQSTDGETPEETLEASY